MATLHSTSTTSSGPQDITFSQFCSYLESIATRKPRKSGTTTTTTRYDTSNKAASDFQNWAHQFKWNQIPKQTGKIIFRLLFPDQDIRRKYGLQETRLGSYLGMIFAVSTKSGHRGEPLVKWDSVQEDEQGIERGKPGCLGLELQKIIQDLPRDDTESPTLAVVDRLLDELAVLSNWSNIGKHPFRKPYRRPTFILQDLYQSLSPREAAYMTQIILKDLRPLLSPLTSSSTYRSLVDYDSKAFEGISPYWMMKAWHWAMPRIYRAKADFDTAADLCERFPRDTKELPADLEQLLRSLTKPQLGTPVNIPKAVKASGPCLAAPLSKLTGQVWAETKMDGERMQIHIDTSKPHDRQIQIFSKSHRDSTKERAPTHNVIRAALGLDSDSTSEDFVSNPRPDILEPITSGIFEAEMVAWNKSQCQVDEFWRISELKLKPWQKPKRDDHIEQNIDQSTSAFTESQIGEMDTQQLSDIESRHLAICFFDVLYLNEKSLVERPYNERRQVLENCIHVIPHYSMLVERKSFDFSRDSARDALREHYATVIADRHEGLMLKTAESIYNDSRSEHKWLKVKKDYIQGCGDTADYAIIGAAWDSKRGRELGVPTSTFTSWYIGLCDNLLDIKRDPNIRPNFQVVFTSLSYGLTRKQLEKANRIAKDIESEPHNSKALRSWPFTYEIASGLAKPTTIFKEPLVFELMGSGFTKGSRIKEYELRWPRITKLHGVEERHWTTAVDLEEHNEMAKRATDPKLLKIADLVSGGSQDKAENGYKAEVEHWNDKLERSDLKWLTGSASKSRSELAATPARLIAPTPVNQATPSRIQEKTASPQTSSVSSRTSNSIPLISREKHNPKPDRQGEFRPRIASTSTSADSRVMNNAHEKPPRDGTPKKVLPIRTTDSTIPSLKRKASGSSDAPTTPKDNPLRRPRLVTFIDPGKAPPANPKNRPEPDPKRRKTYNLRSPSKVPPDKAKFPGLTAHRDASTPRKNVSSQETSSSAPQTPRKRASPIEILDTPPESRPSIKTRVHVATSSVTPTTQTRVQLTSCSVTPKQHDYFAHDLLDIEKFAAPSFGGLGSNLTPLKTPTTPIAKVTDQASSTLSTLGPIASTSISTPRNQFTTDALPSDDARMSSVSSRSSVPSVPHGASEIEASGSAKVDPPELDRTDVTDSTTPPWHRNPNVRWCLVHDEQNYGIQGPRFGSINKLLEALEVDHPNELSDSKIDHTHSDPFSYIFIDNPTHSSLSRIHKQVFYSELSNPHIGIVAYDAKVLKLLNQDHMSWNQFELFRINPHRKS
ncbi:hypothetical protein MJO28_002604 [Puccinia striiformis f. sp. tritici]|uniref:Uncharacterized protein n=1 Tax=Puccinia striiformis f. sp. tritici TaxID=168172 RepID=A0ACC0ERI5_9BASI|nr:hypothetical protein Pst134EB_006517 [Puccinia striiformis f. sp. tritici]KAI7958813.1 hypothetical protein MJO28_002604 [Puccinia striiformis f. sp. tritici]